MPCLFRKIDSFAVSATFLLVATRQATIPTSAAFEDVGLDNEEEVKNVGKSEILC
jgi:hypothetical protein